MLSLLKTLTAISFSRHFARNTVAQLPRPILYLLVTCYSEYLRVSEYYVRVFDCVHI
jgi:hypothetical protein